ncbi:MAG: hypothetical protein KF763_15385 [Cyclobacteriaceae bacterium]|nr:hypothetical protein [Cyclobacteriaceae bacterium]
MITIFSALCAFVLEYKAEIASKIIANAAYDALKKVFDFKSLKGKIKKFFKKDKDADQFIKNICEIEPEDSKDPEIDLKSQYEKISGQEYSNELSELIKEWIKENKATISTINEMSFANKKGFNIGVQNAKKNIFNIQGDFIQKPKKKKS